MHFEFVAIYTDVHFVLLFCHRVHLFFLNMQQLLKLFHCYQHCRIIVITLPFTMYAKGIKDFVRRLLVQYILLAYFEVP